METWLFKVFRSELEDYAKEGRELHMCCQKNKPWSNPTMMTWRLVTGLTLECEVEFVDNKEVLQLLDGRGGVLDVLDEEVGGVLGMGQHKNMVVMPAWWCLQEHYIFFITLVFQNGS